MKISVVIPTCRRPVSLLRCLVGLERQHRLPDEVLIAYRTDDPLTLEMLRSYANSPFAVRQVPVGLANASEARNLCLAVATGDVVAMIDDDTIPRPSWLRIVEGWFQADPSLGGLGGPDWTDGDEVDAHDRPDVVGAVQWWGRRVGNHHRGCRKPVDVEWLKGANMSVRMAALSENPFGRHLRGNDAQFAEDVALSLQVRRAGWRLLYDPDAAVDHFPGQLPGEGDHRGLGNDDSLFDAAHNEAIAMLGYLSLTRRLVFMAWSYLVGTRLLPGLVAASVLALSGRRDAFHRCRVVWRGRRAAWQQWRKQPAAFPPFPAHVSAGTHEAARIAVRQRHVCLVTHLVTPADGQGRVNYELTRHLLRHGYDVTLVASRVHPDLLQLKGLRWIRIPVPRSAPHPVQWALFALGVWWKLGRNVAAFDVVHLNGAIASLPADVNTSHFVHATSRRTSCMVDEEGGLASIYQQIVASASSYFESRAYQAADRVIAISEAVRGSLSGDVGIPSEAIEVIPLGVDSARFRPHMPGETRTLRLELGLSSHTFLVLFVGDAKSPRKNLDLAIEAVVRLSPTVHLAVIGASKHGPYPAKVARLGIQDRVHFLGMRSDVAECYRDADVLFCASHYEPASLVLLEAMASGVPVISAPHVGNASFVRDGVNGFLLRSSRDLDQLVSVIAALASDPLFKVRVGSAAREAVSTLTWERMGQRYEAIYRTVGQHAPATAGVAT